MSLNNFENLTCSDWGSPSAEKRCTRKKMEENITKELAPLRFSQFPGVPPFLNFIVGPGDCPVHPPPILRSSENLRCMTLYQGGRCWQHFGEGKNDHKNFSQARVYYFCDKCVVFARNCKFAHFCVICKICHISVHLFAQ